MYGTVKIPGTFNQKLRSDLPGRVFNTIRRSRLWLLCRYSTQTTCFLLRLKGIALGHNATFFGRPYVHRTPLSNISIGSDCSFRSDATSNLVGVNRRCMISTLRPEAAVVIGNGVGMSGTVIGAARQVIIEDGVLCGANVLITDWDWHPLAAAQRHTIGGEEARPVRIGRNAWIGLNTVVLKGVTIGENTVIGANSLVTHDIPANVIAGGNPCRVIRPIQGVQQEKSF